MAERTRSQFNAAIHRVPPCSVSCCPNSGVSRDGSRLAENGYSVDIACVNHNIASGLAKG
jgi:hypothetical protein